MPLSDLMRSRTVDHSIHMGLERLHNVHCVDILLCRSRSIVHPPGGHPDLLLSLISWEKFAVDHQELSLLAPHPCAVLLASLAALRTAIAGFQSATSGQANSARKALKVPYVSKMLSVSSSVSSLHVLSTTLSSP